MMNIRTLKLTNLGRFEELDVHLAPVEEFKSNVTVFIGNNGAGKTSILKSLATSLSWFVARVRTEKGNGSPIPEDAILNGRSSATIELQALPFVACQNGQWEKIDHRLQPARGQPIGCVLSRSIHPE